MFRKLAEMIFSSKVPKRFYKMFSLYIQVCMWLTEHFLVHCAAVTGALFKFPFYPERKMTSCVVTLVIVKLRSE